MNTTKPHEYPRAGTEAFAEDAYLAQGAFATESFATTTFNSPVWREFLARVAAHVSSQSPEAIAEMAEGKLDEVALYAATGAKTLDEMMLSREIAKTEALCQSVGVYLSEEK